MQKRVVVMSVVLLILLSSLVFARMPLFTTKIVRPAEVFKTIEQPAESGQNGFELRKAVFDKFPDVNDKRVRKADLSRVTMIRTLFSQSLDKKVYRSPDFKLLSCAGRTLFDKDKSMIQPLVELACLKGVQVPLLRSSDFGRIFATGSAAKITGNAAAGIFNIQKTDCNDAIKDISFEALQTILNSEHALIAESIASSNCGDMTSARTLFSRGESHASALRFASAINAYEDAWRKSVSCVCLNIG